MICRTVHLKIKDNICNDCGAAFSLTSVLNNHINTVHLNKKKFICEQCGLEFSMSGNLKTHIKSVHQKVKEECPRCSDKVHQGACDTVNPLGDIKSDAMQL